MTRTVRIAFTGLVLAAAGLAAPAGAQPRLEQTGDGYSVVHDGAGGRGDAAGGREGRLVGGGGDAAVLYTGPDPARQGRAAMLSGGGDDAAISYAEPGSVAGTEFAASAVARRG